MHIYLNFLTLNIFGLHSISGYDAFPMIPIPGSSGRASCNPNQVELAVRDGNPVLHTPLRVLCNTSVLLDSALNSRLLGGDALVSIQ